MKSTRFMKMEELFLAVGRKARRRCHRCAGLLCPPVLLMFGAAGCSTEFTSSESALNPAGPQAQRISALFWLFTGVCAVVYVLVMIMVVCAFMHRRRGRAMEPTNEPITEPDPVAERKVWRVVGISTAITVITLFVLIFSDFATGRAIHSLSDSPNPLRIKIIGHQWWWEVRYLDWPERFGEKVPSNTIFTANEIHIPVDTQNPVAVEFQLDSADVIHSFWVPSLHGKKDMIPGHPTSHWIRADRIGTFWGECAEYCGYQHAQMRLTVVAEPADQFKAWLDVQRADAPEPQTEIQKKGQTVFLHASCAMCHAIQGTEARGNLGPDLTHIAGRKLLASGAAPNVPGHLAGWVIDPQKMKPGVRMPQNNLSPDDLRSLLEYLETLK